MAGDTHPLFPYLGEDHCIKDYETRRPRTLRFNASDWKDDFYYMPLANYRTIQLIPQVESSSRRSLLLSCWVTKGITSHTFPNGND